MTFYLDGTSLGTASAPSAFSLNWDTTTTSDGLHILTAIAVDSAGLTTISAPVPVTVTMAARIRWRYAFVTAYAIYNLRLRNDFTGFAGTQFTVTSATRSPSLSSAADAPPPIPGRTP